jgi:hypothetical protein
VSLRLSTEVLGLAGDRVELREGSLVTSLRNDLVVACRGSETTFPALGSRAGAYPAPGPGPLARPPPPPSGLGPWLLLAGLLGACLLGGLAWLGGDYYALSGPARLASPLHELFRPASQLGLDIGIAATAVMLTNFLYALRKRWRPLAGLGALSDWLQVHVFVGMMSPLVILFHAAFQANNGLARFTYASLGVVVGTGLVGRYVHGLIPGGGEVRLADVLAQRDREGARLRPFLAGVGGLEALLAEAEGPVSRAPFVLQLAGAGGSLLGFRLRLGWRLWALPPGARQVVRTGLLRVHRLRLQAGMLGGARRLMGAWRALHATLAVLLVLALVAHVGLAAYLGYLPTFRNP